MILNALSITMIFIGALSVLLAIWGGFQLSSFTENGKDPRGPKRKPPWKIVPTWFS